MSAGSTARRAAVACCEGLVAENGSCSARLTFPPDYVGFQGHFPDNPILPGVCLIEAVLGVLERAWSQSLRLREIRSAKFRDPIKPGQAIVVHCASSIAGSGLRVSARVSRLGAHVADLVLHVTPS